MKWKKLKYTLGYLKDVPGFLKYLIFDYRKDRMTQMEYDRKTSFTAFPLEYELEIEAKVIEERFRKRQRF